IKLLRFFSICTTKIVKLFLHLYSKTGAYKHVSELRRKKQSDVMRLDVWVTRPRSLGAYLVVSTYKSRDKENESG
ncbi:hypothetical protein MKW98_009928, partial [Papaver atlanticum]